MAELLEQLGVVREAGDACDPIASQREGHDAVGAVLAGVARGAVAQGQPAPGQVGHAGPHREGVGEPELGWPLAALALCLAPPLVAAESAPPKSAPATGSGSATVDKPCDGSITDLDPTGTVTGACNDVAGSLPNVPSPKEIAELPKKAATEVLNDIKDDVVSTMAAGVAKAASWLLGKTLDAITGSTTPDVTSKWFVGQYAQMAGLAALFAIPFLVFAAIQSVAATDWGISPAPSWSRRRWRSSSPPWRSG